MNVHVIPAAIDRSGPTPRFFWLPHRLEVSEEPEKKLALARLAASFRGQAGVKRLSVRLRQGDTVIIDNRRWLHGRASVPATSPRLPYRLWTAGPERNAEPLSVFMTVGYDGGSRD